LNSKKARKFKGGVPNKRRSFLDFIGKYWSVSTQIYDRSLSSVGHKTKIILDF